MVDKMLLQIPSHFETERLYLRCYEPGDGPWFYGKKPESPTASGKEIHRTMGDCAAAGPGGSPP